MNVVWTISLKWKSQPRDFGYDKMQLWDKAKLKQHLGSDIYVGGLYDSNSGHLHPLNYCLGLAKACLDLGVQFTNNPQLWI